VLSDSADEDLLRAVADGFEKSRAGAEATSYWFNYYTKDDPKPQAIKRGANEESEACVVM
jgi:hypothetical protein